MQDDNQISNPQSQIPNIQGDQGQAQAVTQAPPQPQATQPVSTSGAKEGVPVSTSPQKEWIQETAPEAKVTEAVAEAGVEATKGDVLHVAPEVQEAGVQAVGMATPLPMEPTLKLPITEEKAQGILKMHKKVKESVTWLAMLVVRQMQLFTMQQKKKEEKK